MSGIEYYHKGGWTDVSPWTDKDKEAMAPTLSRGTGGRAYVWPPNTANPEYQVPSVTTIMNEYAKPWLGPWMAKAAGQFTSENLDSLMAMPREAVADVVTRSSKRISEKAMGKGSKVHAALELWVAGKGELATMDDLPEIGAGIRFFEDHVAEVLFTEATVFNLTYKYAGTLDNVSRLKDERIAIIDFKTGKRIYKEVAIQLSAYANGEFIGYDTGETEDMPQIDVGIVVHLKDGKYTAREIDLTDGLFKAFIALRTLTKYRAFIEPDVLGATMKGSAAKVVSDDEEQE